MRQFEHAPTNCSNATAEPTRAERGNGRSARRPQEPRTEFVKGAPPGGFGGGGPDRE